MTEKIKFEDWTKLELRIGEVKKASEKIIVNVKEKDFEVDLDLDVHVGDKIVVGINGEELIVPLIESRKGKIPLFPEKDIDAGSRVG